MRGRRLRRMYRVGGQEPIAPWYCGHANADKTSCLRQKTRLQNILVTLAGSTVRRQTTSTTLLGHAAYESIRGNRRLQATAQMSLVASGLQVQNCDPTPLR
jgi:hypothetical protein